jgi:hypothetical protein
VQVQHAAYGFGFVQDDLVAYTAGPGAFPQSASSSSRSLCSPQGSKMPSLVKIHP